MTVCTKMPVLTWHIFLIGGGPPTHGASPTLKDYMTFEIDWYIFYKKIEMENNFYMSKILP